MTDQDEAIASLRDAGLLDVLTWAASAAFAATNQIYDEDAGHDQGVVGYLNFKHLTDLMDRATSNGRFALGEDVDGVGDDVLQRGITPDAYRSMPSLASDAVARSDYEQSPGWASGSVRVLLQSYTFGEIDNIKWTQKSEAKRRVATQLFVAQGTLFEDEDFDLESISGIPGDEDFEGVTLVAAHAFNPTTKQYELYIGQSKVPQHRQESCWHWKQLLQHGGTPIGGSELSELAALPGSSASTDVTDVPMRIKKTQPNEGTGATNG